MFKHSKNKDDASYNEALKRINKAHIEHKQEAQTKGKNDGLKGLPPLYGSSLAVFIALIVNKYKTLEALCEEIMQPQLQKDLGAARKDETEKKNAVIEDKINKKTDKRDLLKTKIEDSLPVWSIVAFLCGVIVSLFIITADWANMSRSLQFLGGSLMLSRLLALGITFSVAAIADLGQMWIAQMRSIIAKRIATVAIIAGMLFLFIGLGELRAEFMERVYKTDGHIFYFVLINMVLFGALFLTFRYIISPSLETVKEAFQDIKVKGSIGFLNWQINRLDAKKKKNDTDLSEYLEARMTAIRRFEMLKHTISCYLDESISEYIQANIAARPDGQVPECFNEPRSPLYSSSNDSN